MYAVFIITVFLLSIVAFIALPIMAMMYYINSKQHHYFALLAQQFSLQKSKPPKGWRMGVRDWPITKGHYQGHSIAVYASKTTTTTKANHTSFAHPLTTISIKANHKAFDTFKLCASKNYRRNKKMVDLIDASEFSQYFNSLIQPQDAELLQQYFSPSIQTVLIEHLKRYKKENCTIILTEKGDWECALFFELTNPKRYEAVLSMLNILFTLNNSPKLI